MVKNQRNDKTTFDSIECLFFSNLSVSKTNYLKKITRRNQGPPSCLKNKKKASEQNYVHAQFECFSRKSFQDTFIGLELTWTNQIFLENLFDPFLISLAKKLLEQRPNKEIQEKIFDYYWALAQKEEPDALLKLAHFFKTGFGEMNQDLTKKASRSWTRICPNDPPRLQDIWWAL